MRWWLVRETARNWASLSGLSVMSVLAPTKTRLRRTRQLGEVERCKLPWTRLETLTSDPLEDTEAVVMKAVHCDSHNCSIHELATLAALTKWARPRKGLEFGTYDGRSALTIAANMPPEGMLWTLNLPPDHASISSGKALTYDEKLASKVESGHRFRSAGEANRITQIFGDSTRYDFTGMGPFQFIFIDGGHAQDVVMADSVNAMRMVDRTRGIILWHDATRFGVRPALEHLRNRNHKIYLILGTTLAVMCLKGGAEVTLPF